jgi:nitrous oxidase accessory protein
VTDDRARSAGDDEAPASQAIGCAAAVMTPIRAADPAARALDDPRATAATSGSSGVPTAGSDAAPTRPVPSQLERTSARNPAASERRAPDPVATVTIVAVAVIALVLSWLLPWWVMKARAPQYGQRTLVVEIGPRTVEGDIREIDLLGHYVGIQPMGTIAHIERTIAPFGVCATILGVLACGFCRRRWLRVLAVLPAIVMPVLVLVDLKLWMVKTVHDRNQDSSLNLTVKSIDPKLFGEYEVGQFKVATELGGGFYAGALASLLGLGLAFAVPLSIGRRRVVAIVLGAGVAATIAAPAHAAELAVGNGYDTIAAAVTAARDGDVVLIPEGIHHEHVTLDRSVRLVGRPGAVIDGDGEGTVLRITAPGVEVRGLTVRGSGSTYTSEDTGIRIDHAADVRVVDTRIEDTLFGIFVAQGDRCVIERSTVIGKDLPHVRRGDGIRLWYSSGCRLTGNLVERSRDVVIWYSSGTLVEDNVVRTSRYGLHYMYSDRNVFHRNRFEDNQVGAAIMYSRGIELTENAFSFSRGPAAYGVLLKDADDVFITGNRFIENTTGLFIDGAPQSKDGRVDVHGNLIARNDVGLALQPLSRRIRFWENAFVGNRGQVQIVGTGSADENVWAVGGRGNYWSDATLYDRDGDGVSELPYRLESTYEVLADRYPALAFFDATPAAEAIDLAARLFPIFAPRPKLTDPYPLVQAPLTAWTRSDGAATGRAGFAVAGVALLSLGALCVAGGVVRV